MIFGSPVTTFTKLGNLYKPFFSNVIIVTGDSSKFFTRSVRYTVSDIGGGLQDISQNFRNLAGGPIYTIIDTSKSISMSLILPIKQGVMITKTSNFPQESESLKMKNRLANSAFVLGFFFDKAQNSLTQGLEKTNEIFSFFGNVFKNSVLYSAAKIEGLEPVLKSSVQ